MPNQRAKNKVYLGGYVEQELQKTIVRAAREAGMENNKFGFVAQLVREALERRGKTVKPSKAVKPARAGVRSTATKKVAMGRRGR